MANVVGNPKAITQPWSGMPTPSPNGNDWERVYPNQSMAETAGPFSGTAKQWINIPLRRWSVCLFILTDTTLIIIILALLIVSLRQTGFVTVGSALSAYGTTFRLSLLWTTFPSLVFTCLGLHWGAIASAASDRQPFEALSRPNGGPASETVLLDYRAMIAPKMLWVAFFRNRHRLVGCAQLAALVFSVLSPLAASLFVATTALFGQGVPVAFNTTFDQNTLNSSMDISPVLDAVRSTLIYGAPDLPWTDSEHAFRPFYYTPTPPDADTNATALAAKTTAHSAYLNCAVLQPGVDGDCKITVKSQSSSPELPAGLVMTATDRGCPIRQEFTVTESQAVYLTTSADISCSAAAQYSRLVFTYGHLAPESKNPPFLSNASVVSCAVGYRKVDGDLSVAVSSSPRQGNDNTTAGGGDASGSGGSGKKLEILSFRPTQAPQDSRGGFWRVFELDLFQSQAFSADTAWSTTDFGTVVLYRALQRQGAGTGASTDNSTVLSGQALADSAADVFTSVYLTAMATVGLVPNSGGRREVATGMLETEVTRLFVVPWVAGTVIAVLALILAVAVWVLRHVRRHETLLFEEPAGLVAYAGLLEGSELLETVRGVRDAEGYDGEVVPAVQRNWNGAGGALRNRWKLVLIRGNKAILVETTDTDASRKV